MTAADITTTRHTRSSRTIPTAIGSVIAGERAAARRAARSGDIAEAWRLLERTHILSQPWARPHVHSHIEMLRLGIRTRSGREVLGQVVRILVAGPGSALGRYPRGNTGRADVPATAPMPVPDDLAALLDV